MSGINTGDEQLVFESSEQVKVVSTFDQLGLKEDLLRGIYAYGAFICLKPPQPKEVRVDRPKWQALKSHPQSNKEPFYL